MVLNVRTGCEWAQSDQKLNTHLSGLGPQGCNSGPEEAEAGGCCELETRLIYIVRALPTP